MLERGGVYAEKQTKKMTVFSSFEKRRKCRRQIRSKKTQSVPLAQYKRCLSFFFNEIIRLSCLGYPVYRYSLQTGRVWEFGEYRKYHVYT
jgi:hypothetical protein